MDHFFKPVHHPSAPDEMKPRRHHQHPHHHLHQEPQSQRYSRFDESDGYTDESHGHPPHHPPHHHHPDHYPHDNLHQGVHHHHQTHPLSHSEEDEILFDHSTPVTLSRASSSSLSSSSSSSSFSSWYTEASGTDVFSQRQAARPQHSLSCSNILDARRGFQSDDNGAPVVIATVKHDKPGGVCGKIHESSQQGGQPGFSSLDRGHSRSEEGLLQCGKRNVAAEQSRASQMSYGPLYKTASLNRSLAFSEEDIVLGVSRGPKRAVSSIQLPSKGILKNKEPRPDIRKAKSMEVLSPRVSKSAMGQNGKGATQAEVQQARSKFVQGKVQFSAFLDEITKQVMSPSHLNILGVNNDKSTGKTPAPAPPQKPPPTKPQLPPKKHRESSGDEREQLPKQRNRQEKAPHSGARKHSDCSDPEKLTSYAARSYHGSPPPQRHAHPTGHHGNSRKDRRTSPPGGSVSRERSGGRNGPNLTDGTSTSPELGQPKQHPHYKQQVNTAQRPQHLHHGSPLRAHPDPIHPTSASSPPSSAHGKGAVLRSESSSSKSDSSRARDPAPVALNSERSGRHNSPQYEAHGKQHRDSLCDADHLQALQEENADLQQNLLQTVVCIESLEAELQRSRDELTHVKDKYKSLMETHCGTQQANNLLGEHLHIAAESLSSERKYLLSRVEQLSSELEEAHRTIAALENINVPCLIKELLEKHFDSAEAVQNFLSTSAPTGHPPHAAAAAASQSHAPKTEEAARDWPTKPEAGSQRVTAFTPFKPGTPTPEACHSNRHESGHAPPGPAAPPGSFADISAAICKKMAADYAARPQPLYPQSHQQRPPGTGHSSTDPRPGPQQVRGAPDSWAERGEIKVTLLQQQDVLDVTSLSAQHILDEFMQQLQAQKEVGGAPGPQVRQEWVGGAEQTGKVVE